MAMKPAVTALTTPSQRFAASFSLNREGLHGRPVAHAVEGRGASMRALDK